MKRLLSVLIAVLLAGMSAAACAETPAGTEVAAVFAGADIQPYTEADGDREMLDTVWVYYTDGSFEQFAEVDDQILLFSKGTYEFVGDAGFVYKNPDAGNGHIIIRREKKLSPKGLEDYQSENTFELGTLGFTQLYAPNADRKIVAAFYGNDKQPYTEADGDRENLDTWWIYYSDGTFEQFAIIDAEPRDQIVLFSEGHYQLKEGSSFIYENTPDISHFVTINRTKKFSANQLTDYESSHEYELNTLGFVRIIGIEK